MEKKLKLSKTQQDVLDNMANNWELAESLTRNAFWLQEGGSGRGGKTTKVSSATISVLLKAKLIEVNHRGFPKCTYKLSQNN